MHRLRHHCRCCCAERPLPTTPNPSCSDGSSGGDGQRRPVCLVVGAGAGVGQAVARRFAREGLHVCAVRRGEGQYLWGPPASQEPPGGGGSPQAEEARQRFAVFAAEAEAQGGSAQLFYADGADPTQTAALVATIVSADLPPCSWEKPPASDCCDAGRSATSGRSTARCTTSARSAAS